MDPDTALKDLLSDASDVLESNDDQTDGLADLETANDYLYRMAENATRLHEWIQRGGYLPLAWQRLR